MTREELDAVIAAIKKVRENATDETALDAKAIFPKWKPNTLYDITENDIRLFYGDKLYRVRQTHTSQDGWTPDITPALYEEVALPGEYREIEDDMPAIKAFHLDEIGWYKTKDNLWKSKMEGNTYTPVTAPEVWEKVNEVSE